MQQWWIPARTALDAIALDSPGQAVVAICSRAFEGLLSARARLFIAPHSRTVSTPIPRQFWWATGHDALEQNWDSGDFSTLIDQTLEWKAFGVEFDFIELKDMLSPERGAELSRQYSVAGNRDWLSAAGARQFAWERLGANPAGAGDLILQNLRFGFIRARAVLMQRSPTKGPDDWDLQEREWDVPDWFWRDFTHAGSSAQDWAQGRFSGRGTTPNGRYSITLSGVHFAASALGDLISPSAEVAAAGAPQNKGGRPPKEWWDDLWCAVWGDVYRGDFKPRSQAEIERAMLDWAAAREESVSESTVKPLARKMFIELQR